MRKAVQPIDIAVEDGQRCLKAAPVVVLGSGASIPFGLPSMSDLARHLIESKPEGILDQQENEIWKRFIDELRTKDLESTLGGMQMNENLSNYVVKQTRKYVGTADVKAFDNLIRNPVLLPLSRLYRYLFDSTHHKLSVITTNYDRLAEYAADRAGFCHYTGFTYGYCRRRQTNPRISFYQGGQPVRTIDIWKVHGCLDWFICDDGGAVALTASRDIPKGFRPAIVTPGIGKYEETHQEPFRSVIAGADDALMSASAYLCIGFGFNDKHVQPKLMDRWRQGEAFLVVLAKELSQSAKDMFANANGREFLALEESSTGTRMWSHRFPHGMILEDAKLWRLSDFLNRTT